DEAHDGSDHDKDESFIPARSDDHAERSRTHDGSSSHAADQRVRRRRRKSPPPGEQVPDNRAKQSADHHVLRDHTDINHAAANGFGDGGSQQESGQEVEEGGPYNCELGREDASRNDGGDAIRGIVEAVKKVESLGDEDGDAEKQEVWFHFGQFTL